MRILITYPFPVDDGPAGSRVQRLAAALRGAGHDVHLLVVDRPHSSLTGSPHIRRVTCAAATDAELDFEVPGFETDLTPGRSTPGPTFEALSEDQLSRYRQAQRQALDCEVDTFDPHIVHVEYVWLLAQLVLETGVPYVARMVGPELTSSLGAPRIRALAQQAAENAGRILVADAAQAGAVLEAFEVAAERIAIWPQEENSVAALVELYTTVLDERFGTLPGA